MNRIALIVVEDEPEVREVLVRELEPFEPHFRVEAADSADDAREIFRACARDGDRVGLVLCDHLLPGTKGVDFLVELDRDPATAPVRKVLVTGQAGLEDTVRAVNEARLDHYIAKPWASGELQAVVKKQLTEYVLLNVEDVLPYVSVLDGARLMERAGKRRVD